MRQRASRRAHLNALYEPLFHRAQALQQHLQEGLALPPVCMGFYNGHHHRDEKGTFQKDLYPIPVLELKGLCDVEMDFDRISVTARCNKASALAFPFEDFLDLALEVFGVEDFLTDVCHGNTSPARCREGIRQSRESAFFFSFSFAPETEPKTLSDLLLRLQRLALFD